MNDPARGISNVICVCSRKDAETWQVAAPNILAFIRSDHYSLICPDQDVDYFREITPIAFKVVAESTLDRGLSQSILAHMPADKRDRMGWYLQQYLKLAAASEGQDSETILIWDADTVPLRSLSFVDPQGRLVYYTGREYHLPYFKLIERLIGLTKQINRSFIAQCLIAKSGWVRDFFRELEEIHKVPWYEALSSLIDFNELSGFSEYETLGTYCLAR
jgi:hypothetical protein